MVFMTMRKKRKSLILREPGSAGVETGRAFPLPLRKAVYAQEVAGRANRPGICQQI